MQPDFRTWYKTYFQLQAEHHIYCIPAVLAAVAVLAGSGTAPAVAALAVPGTVPAAADSGTVPAAAVPGTVPAAAVPVPVLPVLPAVPVPVFPALPAVPGSAPVPAAAPMFPDFLMIARN